jgi:CRP-like cAMP-binding protein
MFEAGDFVGEVSALDGGCRAGNAIADQPTILLALDGGALTAIIERNPAVALEVIRGLCQRLREAGKSVEHFALHNAETRIWSRLIALAQRYCRSDPDETALRIEHGYSQQELADSIGITRVMVNRQMIVWRDESLVDYGRGFVLIKDPKALEARVRRGNARLEDRPGRDVPTESSVRAQRTSSPAFSRPS